MILSAQTNIEHHCHLRGVVGELVGFLLDLLCQLTRGRQYHSIWPIGAISFRHGRLQAAQPVRKLVRQLSKLSSVMLAMTLTHALACFQ